MGESLALVHSLVNAGYRTSDDTFTTYPAASLLAGYINRREYVDEPFGDPKVIGGGVLRILVQPVPNAAPPAAEVVQAPVDSNPENKHLHLLEFRNGFRYAAGGLADSIVGGVRLKAIPLDTSGMSQAQADLHNEVNQPSTEAQATGVVVRTLRDLIAKCADYDAAQKTLAEQNKQPAPDSPNPFHPTE